MIKRVEPKLVRETVSEGTANFLKEALFRTVSEGTGKAAAVEGYEIAGKTGTAEKYPRQDKNYLVSFCGFAPAHNPQVLVYVVIDVPHVPSYEQPHSSYASGVFQKIMAEILPYLNIFPAEDPESQEVEGALPEREGITDVVNPLAPGQTEPAPEETKVYQTEEYIESGEGSGGGIPGQLPGGALESGAEESSAPEGAAEESSAAGENGTEGESTAAGETGG